MFDKNLIKKWVQNGIDKSTIQYANEWGKLLVEPSKRYGQALTTSQIRNVYGELKRIQLKGYRSEKTAFLLLKPKMAYLVKRHDKEGVKLFNELFVSAYDVVDLDVDSNGEIHFKNMMHLMEAVLAYHKFHGGKE